MPLILENWMIECLFFLPFKEIPDVPMVDLAFALSATATDASLNFKLMKDTITSFADMYGVSKINYAVITYGQSQRRWVDFQNQPSDFEDMKKIVDAIARETGVVALDTALDEARKLFDGARPQARKVMKRYSTYNTCVCGVGDFKKACSLEIKLVGPLTSLLYSAT